ncbi:MAG: oligosaccharide flippase family protein [Steroidobacteraceae bacterium]
MNARYLVRTGLLIVAAQVAIALISVLALRLYTNLMTPAAFGAANLVLSALGLGLQLFVAGYTAALLRFYSESETPERADAFARKTMSLALRGVVVLVGILLIVVTVATLTNTGAYSPLLFVSGVAWLFAMTVRNVLMSRIQAQRRQAAYAWLQVIEAALLCGVSVGALGMSPTVEAFLIGQTLAVAFVTLVILMADRTNLGLFRIRPGVKGGFGRKAWAYGAPFVPMSLLSWVANLGDRYTLAAMLGPGAAGRYVAPFSIASRGMLLANSALCDLFRPLLFDAENRRDRVGADKTFVVWIAASVALSAAGVAIVHFAGALIAALLLAQGYRAGAVEIMLWVSLGYAVSGVTQIIESRMLSLGHSARLLFPMVLGAIANVTFSIFLIRRNGVIGAAQATCASFVFQNLATAGFLIQALRRRRSNDSEEIAVDTRKIS